MKVWLISIFSWLAIFGLISIWVIIRKTDGAGVIQNDNLRIGALLVLAFPLLMVLIIHLIWYFALKKQNKH